MGTPAALDAGQRGPRVAVVTDSVACIPPDVAGALGIEVVPIWIHLGGRSLRDGVDISPHELYRRLRAGELGSTSAPSPGDFLEAFRRLAERGASAILVITLPAELTAVHRSATLAAEMSPVPVEVVDSRTAAAAQGWVAIEAARALRGGADVASAIARAREVSRRSRLFAMVPELQYLRRGGRAVHALARLGASLGIVPLLALRDGRVEPLAVTRSFQAALDRMVEEMAADAATGRLHVAVMEADAGPQARRLVDAVRARLAPAELITTTFTPAMGVHAGPGIVGVGYWVEPRPT
ncbi:DegV family protein [Geochorda subterranea]|uniref:DegV family protein n=1 Tax=Geochorda subterranea TaxID=3109564 RepID=A0ABZ1BSG8_9FIRM|nr:DegV family protein [Limnochorda sp. LNt]WRP15451.1 DegV family protein [Limnochorda sp. LNt]